MLADASHFDAEDETILHRLRRWWSVAGLVLFAATWKLWTPQTEYPQVPLFGWAGSLPSFVDWLAFGVLLGSLVFCACKPCVYDAPCADATPPALRRGFNGFCATESLLESSAKAVEPLGQAQGRLQTASSARKPESHRAWIALAVSLSVLIILDQHRLQPWAWQLLLMSMFFGSANAGRLGRMPLVALTVSIYFWSAVSKLDADFFASHGQTLVEALLGAIRIDAAAWPERVKWWFATMLPLGELLVAVGLCWPRTRRPALIAATGLHVGLLLALGPLGLRHRPGVLLWNIAFIGHDWLLFGRQFSGGFRREAPDICRAARQSSSLTLRVTLLTLACAWPVTERWGICDRWLAWSVYVARSERVSVTLTDEGMRRLLPSARQCVTDGELRLDQWSLAALDVPIYPQLRFQIGVVEWLRQRCGDDTIIEIVVQHSRGGGGNIERLTIEQFDERRCEFWINTTPRPPL